MHHEDTTTPEEFSAAFDTFDARPYAGDEGLIASLADGKTDDHDEPFTVVVTKREGARLSIASLHAAALFAQMGRFDAASEALALSQRLADDLFGYEEITPHVAAV